MSCKIIYIQFNTHCKRDSIEKLKNPIEQTKGLINEFHFVSEFLYTKQYTNFQCLGEVAKLCDTSRDIAYAQKPKDHSREHLSKISYPEFYQQSGLLWSAIFNSNQTYHRSFKAFGVYISTIKLTEVCFVRHLKLMEYL